MKTCTKCHKELPESCFSSHSQKKDKLNSSCKDCEKASKRLHFKANPLCCRCKSRPHMVGDSYCYHCSREVKGKGEPSHTRRKTEVHLCPRCLVRERGDQPYCPPCKLKYQNEKRAKKWSERYATNESKRIETARAYATGLLARGKIRRGPCVFCGAPGTQFHHYDYERKTRNFDNVCDLCHAYAHIFLQMVVDIYRKFGVRVV